MKFNEIIQELIKGNMVSRPGFTYGVAILPTIDEDSLFVIDLNGGSTCGYYIPIVKDLIANDWEIIN